MPGSLNGDVNRFAAFDALGGGPGPRPNSTVRRGWRDRLGLLLPIVSIES